MPANALELVLVELDEAVDVADELDVGVEVEPAGWVTLLIELELEPPHPASNSPTTMAADNLICVNFALDRI